MQTTKSTSSLLVTFRMNSNSSSSAVGDALAQVSGFLLTSLSYNIPALEINHGLNLWTNELFANLHMLTRTFAQLIATCLQK
jgi:hypothetical protein